MGNSDSKVSKSSRQSITSSTWSSAGDTRARMQVIVESEFERNRDPRSGCLGVEGFQRCLQSVQEQFDLFSIANSPLGVGLFYSSSADRSGEQAIMNKAEYMTALTALLNNTDPNVANTLTLQCIQRWYCSTHKDQDLPSISDEMIGWFFEASWRFAFQEMHRRLSSNVSLRGAAESDAIARFREGHIKDLHKTLGRVGLNTSMDRTLVVTVGEETVSVPTSFSNLSKRRATPEATPRVESFRKSAGAYPDL